MRKQGYFLMMLAMLLSFTAIANRVIIKGTVQYSNGAPAVGKIVWISSGPNTTGSCNIKDSTKTNPNGYFIDTLQCEGQIKAVVVSILNCDGRLTTQTLEVPASGVVELKLTDCLPANCKANFVFERNSNAGNSFYFSSNTSTVGNGDSIVRRVWTFGDGTANEGNNVQVKKEYATGGVYEVCLKIITKSGCINSTCQKVEVPVLSAVCKAGFTFERVPADNSNLFNIRFNSGASNSGVGDEIVSRTWTFGDGTSLTGNELNPLHTYKQGGVYEVCLVIKTRKGCESKWCGKIELRPTVCTPEITYETVLNPATVMGTSIRFNSKYGVMPTPDSIVSRTWIFGDGQTLTGNVPNPIHVYKQTGSYKVCLVTKTRYGCVSEVCRTIQVVVPTIKCEAQFKFERGPENIGYFNASPTIVGPNDAVVKTIWSFGDGSTQTVNGLETKYQYKKAGVFEVCLVVVTRNGCESKVCRKVEIGPMTNTSRCEAKFTIDNSRPGVVIFNSEGSFTGLPDDKIIYRRWDFGNGKIFEGNQVKTEMQYPFGGKFNVCLYIKTAKGCEARICQTVEVKQGQSPNDSSRLWLVRYYPNPVQQQLFAVVYSPKDNEEVELAVVDVYGIVKSINKVKVPKGYSTHLINTGALLPGPYLLRCRSAYGVQSRSFYKVN